MGTNGGSPPGAARGGGRGWLGYGPPSQVEWDGVRASERRRGPASPDGRARNARRCGRVLWSRRRALASIRGSRGHDRTGCPSGSEGFGSRPGLPREEQIGASSWQRLVARGAELEDVVIPAAS